MKPAPFTYLRPVTLSELLETVKATGDSGKVLAGGQSLMPLLNMRLARPGHLIDMNFIPGLDSIEDTGTHLRIGAMVRQRKLELDPAGRRHLPLVVEALRHVAHVQIRHRGTVGGNLAHADPASELPAAMRALDAVFVARSVAGERRIPASEFFVSVFTNSLVDGEVLTHVEVPYSPPGSGSAFEEFARRRGDFALAAAATQIEVTDGVIVDARLALAGVGSVPHRPSAAEAILTGLSVANVESKLNEVARVATDGLDPSPDLEAPTVYRLELAQELTRRAIRRALHQAQAAA